MSFVILFKDIFLRDEAENNNCLVEDSVNFDLRFLNEIKKREDVEFVKEGQ